MKKLYLLLIFLAFAAIAQAQHISVKDFYYAENDLTARTYGTSVEDQNGNLCALIKVRTTERGMWTFDVGMMGVTKIETQKENHSAEIWVYVPFGVTRMTIQHEKLGILDKWPFPCSIEKGCTYIMELTTGKVKTIVEEAVNQQYLAFQITPADAVLEVNGKIWEVDADGNAQEYVGFGSYEYRVQAPNYHSAVGKVTVNDPDNTVFRSVTLDPNFGWIEVGGTGDLQGASVYVDNALIGKAPCKSDALKSGQHTVRIAKKMYDTYSVTVTVNDNQTTPVNPVLEANFANVTLSVDADAEIWVNNERKGIRTWTGALGYGSYKVECKQANHETSLTTLEVTAALNGETYPLPSPAPIYGSLNVESTPKFCRLYIDGKDMGTTPKSVNQILIGQHEIRLTKEGYAEYKETITITKGERKQVTATLTADGSAPAAEKPKQPETPSVTTPKSEVKQPVAPKSSSSAFFVMANAAYSIAPQFSFGLTIGSVKKLGWYVSLGTNFNFDNSNGAFTCDGDGNWVNQFVGDYKFTGASKTSRVAATAGLAFKISDPLYAYAGAGYGYRNLYWYYTSTGGQGYAKNMDYSYQGLAVDAGLMLHFNGFGISLGVQTIGVKYMEAKIGIGYTLKRK